MLRNCYAAKCYVIVMQQSVLLVCYLRDVWDWLADVDVYALHDCDLDPTTDLCTYIVPTDDSF